MDLVRRATELGALGATISGAGPTVLFWVFFEQTGALVERLREDVGDAAEVRRLNFVALGADVSEL
jgi:homoserine kinase